VRDNRNRREILRNVFKITPRGALTTLYNFCSEVICAAGAFPYAGLVIGTDGNFYGTTSRGANDACGNEGCGTVFRTTPAGTPTTLHRFDQTDSAEPTTAMVQAADNDFYGTPPYGGKHNACKHGCARSSKSRRRVLRPRCTISHSTRVMAAIRSVGWCRPQTEILTGPLHRGEKHGTIYKFVYRSGRGTLTALHKFDGTDTLSPGGGLLQATNGSFYGASAYGGSECSTYGCGTAFSLSVGPEPFVETLPASGKVGRNVTILGNDLMGATGVTFNGTAATFKVIGNSEIKATVPVGATTGFVTVMTPRTTLKSNVVFRVPK